MSYANGIKERATTHGIRLSEVDKWPQEQEYLMTWLEYFEYESRKRDRDMQIVFRMQSQHEEAWRVLNDARVLRSHETEDFVCSPQSGFQHMKEREQAEKHLDFEHSALLRAQQAAVKPHDLGLLGSQASSQLKNAQLRVAAARDAVDKIEERNSLVGEFLRQTRYPQTFSKGIASKSYLSAKEDADHRAILLNWILSQVPLIILALDRSPSCTAQSQAPNQPGRKRACEVGGPQERPSSKRLRFSVVEACPKQVDGLPSVSANSNPQQEPRDGYRAPYLRYQKGHEDPPLPKQCQERQPAIDKRQHLRRSTRISKRPERFQ